MSDHITTQLALAQLPTRLRRGRQTLIRTDSVGGIVPACETAPLPSPSM